MKHIIFIVIFLVSAIAIYGQSYMNYPQVGAYGGLETGIARVSVRGEFVINKATELKEHINQNYTKGVIGANLGYGYYIAESFVGIEFHYSLYTKKISDTYTQEDFDFDISIGSKSELDLIIGRKIGSRSLLTLRGGIAFSNIEIIADNNLNNENNQISRDSEYFQVHLGYRLNDNKPMRKFFGWFEDHLGF